MHPEYLSSKYARQTGLRLIEVQHHHAHVAACLAENGRPLDVPPTLGIVLDGLGWGDDGTIWGGEFLLADYRVARRVGMFKPVAMPGGAAAVREPWRNLYAHLLAAGLEPLELLGDKPCSMLEAMIRHGVNSPMASSCGRLFDAVAAAVGICRDRQGHEGEAASRLEAIVCRRTLHAEDDVLGYPMTQLAGEPAVMDARALWQAITDDLHRGSPPAVIAARFHKGLAISVATMTRTLARRWRFDTVALSGGCFQNAILFGQTERRLRDAGFHVLSHSVVPTNDGGLALGQAAVAAARLMG
jgi:hydrogenase maturation protein HypF